MCPESSCNYMLEIATGLLKPTLVKLSAISFIIILLWPETQTSQIKFNWEGTKKRNAHEMWESLFAVSDEYKDKQYVV